MGTIFAIFISFGKTSCVSDKLIICVKRGLNTVLLDLSTIAGIWSHPVAQFFRLSMVLLISSMWQGAKNKLIGHLVLIYDVGLLSEGGIFVSRVGPMFAKKLLKWEAIIDESVVDLPLTEKIVVFWTEDFFLFITFLITCQVFLRLFWFCKIKDW